MIDADITPPPSGIDGEALSPEALAYYYANREGIDSWNAFIAEHGLPLVDTWDF